MNIIPVDEIQAELLKANIQKQNFPKNIGFTFDPLYTHIVSQMKTMEISSECILYSSAEASNTTKEFSNKAYWDEKVAQNEIDTFWFFGQNGQGDLWLFDSHNTVHFYDHDKEEMHPKNFLNLKLNFGQWLQLAFLVKQLDEMYDTVGKINTKTLLEFKGHLQAISRHLSENYPFRIG